MIRRLTLCVLFASVLVLQGTVSPAVAGNSYLIAYMNGGNEVPGPGDANASGRAAISIVGSQLCLRMWWQNVDGTPSGLHIHHAPPGVAGPVVVPFPVPPAGATSTYQCVTVENGGLLHDIGANPASYYINLHSTPLHPAGALRGQLQSLT